MKSLTICKRKSQKSPGACILTLHGIQVVHSPELLNLDYAVHLHNEDACGEAQWHS